MKLKPEEYDLLVKALKDGYREVEGDFAVLTRTALGLEPGYFDGSGLEAKLPAVLQYAESNGKVAALVHWAACQHPSEVGTIAGRLLGINAGFLDAEQPAVPPHPPKQKPWPYLRLSTIVVLFVVVAVGFGSLGYFWGRKNSRRPRDVFQTALDQCTAQPALDVKDLLGNYFELVARPDAGWSQQGMVLIQSSLLDASIEAGTVEVFIARSFKVKALVFKVRKAGDADQYEQTSKLFSGISPMQVTTPQLAKGERLALLVGVHVPKAIAELEDGTAGERGETVKSVIDLPTTAEELTKFFFLRASQS